MVIGDRYKVKSGSVDGEWSDVFSFRAGYAKGVTKMNIYGDMGVCVGGKGNMNPRCGCLS